MRIVSLLPAATDLVVTLGLAGDLVGRTHECDWPPGELEHAAVVTRTALAGGLASREISTAVAADRAHAGSSLYALDEAALAALHPDLIITQELCEVCAVSYGQVAAAVRVADTGPRLVSLEPATLAEVLGTLTTVGGLTGRSAAGRGGAGRRRAAAGGGGPGGRRSAAARGWSCWSGSTRSGRSGTGCRTRSRRPAARRCSASPARTPTRCEWAAVVAAAPEVLVLAPCGFPPERTLAELPALTARPGWSSLPAVRSGAGLGGRRAGVLQPARAAGRPRGRGTGARAARNRDDRSRGGGFCRTPALASRA